MVNDCWINNIVGCAYRAFPFGNGNGDRTIDAKFDAIRNRNDYRGCTGDSAAFPSADTNTNPYSGIRPGS